MPLNNYLVVGISGATCSGKTTTATKLNEMLPKSKVFSQDDYFLDENDAKHTWIEELNHINFDIVSSLDMEKMHQDILNYANQSVKNGFLPKEKVRNLNVIIIEGFCIFNYKPILPIFDLKYYFTLSKDECYKRRLTRVYYPPDCPGYFEKCVWPEHLKQKEEVVNAVDNVVFFDENTGDVVPTILADIERIFKQNRC